MIKTRFFQSGKYISVDFLNREAEVIEIDEKKSELPIMILEAENGKKRRFILVNLRFLKITPFWMN